MEKVSNSKNKKIIKLIICLIVIIILGLILEKQISLKKEENRQLERNGFSEVYKGYSGEYKIADITEKLNEVTTGYIPRLYKFVKKYDDSELEDYYDKNKNTIRKRIGLTSYEEFKETIDNLKSKKINLEKWERLDVVKDSFVNESDKEGYAYVEYEVTYSRNKVIRFSLYIAQKAKKTPAFIIKCK